MITVFEVPRISMTPLTFGGKKEIEIVRFINREVALEFAKRECRNANPDMLYHGKRAVPEDIVSKSVIFDTLEEITEIEIVIERRAALNKLTKRERELLGLTDSE